MIQGIQNLVFSQPHVRKYPALICTFKNFFQNADGNTKVFERANLTRSQKDFDDNYYLLNNIFNFANTIINLKKEVKRHNKKKYNKLEKNKIESVNFYFCHRKLVIFKPYKNTKQNAGNGVDCLICKVGIPVPL
ncbi:MAG: hypothetical protein A2491_07075 [Bacteroidetes bacterium RIFOXYC12_FULL_35_7]|nr:MAG: hypothetical protein A2491_07075 [Bacteroidetes bacterium RIFOXYC12_FULL_35_7]